MIQTFLFVNVEFFVGSSVFIVNVCYFFFLLVMQVTHAWLAMVSNVTFLF